MTDEGGTLRESHVNLIPTVVDGTSIVGSCSVQNLLLATGHGTLGWTMAAGTGRVIAELVSGKTPEIDEAGLNVARYRA